MVCLFYCKFFYYFNDAFMIHFVILGNQSFLGFLQSFLGETTGGNDGYSKVSWGLELGDENPKKLRIFLKIDRQSACSWLPVSVSEKFCYFFNFGPLVAFLYDPLLMPVLKHTSLQDLG